MLRAVGLGVHGEGRAQRVADRVVPPGPHVPVGAQGGVVLLRPGDDEIAVAVAGHRGVGGRCVVGDQDLRTGDRTGRHPAAGGVGPTQIVVHPGVDALLSRRGIGPDHDVLAVGVAGDALSAGLLAAGGAVRDFRLLAGRQQDVHRLRHHVAVGIHTGALQRVARHVAQRVFGDDLIVAVGQGDRSRAGAVGVDHDHGLVLVGLRRGDAILAGERVGHVQAEEDLADAADDLLAVLHQLVIIRIRHGAAGVRGVVEHVFVERDDDRRQLLVDLRGAVDRRTVGQQEVGQHRPGGVGRLVVASIVDTVPVAHAVAGPNHYDIAVGGHGQTGELLVAAFGDIGARNRTYEIVGCAGTTNKNTLGVFIGL